MEMTNALEPARGSIVRCPLIALICCCAALSGCRVDVAETLEQEKQWTVIAYDNGRAEPSRTVARDSPQAAELLKWAKAIPEGWNLALPDYVPGLLVFSPSFRLNLQSSLAVYSTGRLQYSKSISEAEYRRLRQVLAAESPSP
jgi:hypothetical protein